MDEERYEQYRTLKASGKKREAKVALDTFIDSFTSRDDKRQWVRTFLTRGDFGHKIRHEIYERLVFPVLLEGHNRRDAWSTLWLARTYPNLHDSPSLHSHIAQKTEWQLLREAYDIEPNDEVRACLLQTDLDWFDYCQHEWPAGILYGYDGATFAECEELLSEAAFARTLDIERKHAAFLEEFERKVKQYQQRLQQA